MDKELIDTALAFSPHILKANRKKKKTPTTGISKLSLKNKNQPASASDLPTSANIPRRRTTRRTEVRNNENLLTSTSMSMGARRSQRTACVTNAIIEPNNEGAITGAVRQTRCTTQVRAATMTERISETRQSEVRSSVLCQSNSSNESGSRRNLNRSKKCDGYCDKENIHPCQCDEIITSDSSGNNDPRQVQLVELISEDEDTEQVVETDAKTTVTLKSSSTYITCVSNQARRGDQTREISETSDDDVDNLQSSFKTLILTPENRNTQDGCEKVQQWLMKTMNVSLTRTSLENSMRRTQISESSSCDNDSQHSNTKESSTAYPTTVMSSRYSFSSEDSLHGTSRISSSAVSNSQTVSLVLEQKSAPSTQVSEPLIASSFLGSEHVPSSVSQVTIEPERNLNGRESIISILTKAESQGTTSTRSSSIYFVDRPPWSKHYQPKKKPVLPNSSPESFLSDIGEQNENNISNVESSPSFRLVYEESEQDVSPRRNETQVRVFSQEISSVESTQELSPSQFSEDIANTRNIVEISPSDVDISPTEKSHAPERRYIESSTSVISGSVESNQPHHIKFTTIAKDNGTKILESCSVADTVPWRDSMDSFSSVNKRAPPSCNKKSTTTSSSVPDTVPWRDSMELLETMNLPSRNPGQQTEKDKKSLGSSVADTIPWSDSALDAGPSVLVNPPPRTAPESKSSSGSDVFSWPLYNKSEIKNILKNIRQTIPPPVVENDNSSVATTVPWPSDSDSMLFDYLQKVNTEQEACESSGSSEVVLNENKFDLTMVPNHSEAKSTQEQEKTHESQMEEINVSIQKNLSIIEISSDEEHESPGESSDSDEESPQRFFRRRKDRASYVEIVISETESEEEKDENIPEDDDSDSSTQSKTRKLTRSPMIIPSSGSDSDASSIEVYRRRQLTQLDSSVEIHTPIQSERKSTRVSAVKDTDKSYFSEEEGETSKNLSNNSKVPPYFESYHESTRVSVVEEDSQKTHFSGDENEANNSINSRVPPYFEMPEISEDEIESSPKNPARHLDFDAEKASSEEDEGKAGPSRERKKSSVRPARLSKSPFSQPIVSLPRTRTYSESSDDDDDRLEQFFQTERKKREEALHRLESLDDSPNFIVPDHETSDHDEGTSPAFYLQVINTTLRKEVTETWQTKPTFKTPKPPPPTTPTPKKGRQVSKTVGRIQSKPSYLGGPTFSPVLSFVASLSATNHSRCHPDAVRFLKKFNHTKQELANKLFATFNEYVFKNKLQTDMSITWNNRLRSTAGFCYNQRKPQPNGEYLRSSRIELSSKILHDAGRLRDTLIHEMCHAATWVISGQLGGHGPVWKEWTRKARRCFPELPEINRCHSYEVKTKYTYRCVECGYSFGRHSKSLDLQKKVCGLCRGKFELLIHGTPAKNSAATPRTPNVFALFVKENYQLVKNNRKSLKHADVMKMLSQKFAAHKIAKK